MEVVLEQWWTVPALPAIQTGGGFNYLK